MSLLSVRGISKRFGGLTAVDDVSFEVFEGTIKALIGPNGAGKSTLFNLLTGFERPDAGSVSFGGTALGGKRPHEVVRVGLARTFQNTQLFEEMTGAENVLVGMHPTMRTGFMAGALRLPSTRAEERDARERVGHLLRLVGADQYADTPAADVPHGVRRLLEIARALATSPRLLLLDEPAAGLNNAETRTLATCLRRIRDDGITILVVEHDMGLVMDVSEEIVVLDRGRKIAEGPPLLIQKDAAVIEAYLGEEAVYA
ncbi:MAG: ABC transporter ATP-binding protein [Actinomycetota bacterium]|nr:MAG: branched-chain amino acid transport system ATP-binding [Actinomycetota bacterium]MDO8949946.1 ABC transporter ATP-binding protein [Actinomycetota bacterium]MDP3631181.1 ABC transporter ATP-binding protein [Actinomycetota bacterium]